MSTARLQLRTRDGRSRRGDRWLGVVTPTDRRVLEAATPPVLDVGCGPGRHCEAIAARGDVVLGIDITPCAIEVARMRGATVLHRSVFDRIPGVGRWSTVLLLGRCL